MPKPHPTGGVCSGPDCDRRESGCWYGEGENRYCKKGKCWRRGKELGHIKERSGGARKRARDCDDEPGTPTLDRLSKLVKLKYICAHR